MQTPNVPRRIAERVVRQVIEGKLQPGQRLPSERTLAARLGVSRNALREAARLLESAGMVTVHHGSGTFVARSDSATHMAQALAPSHAQAVAPRDLQELYRLRRVLEPEAARWAAETIAAGDIARLQELQASAELAIGAKPLDYKRLAALHHDIHTGIFRASGSAVMMRVMDSLLVLLTESRRYTIRQPGRAHKSIAEHRKIIAAIARHNPSEAHRLMLLHIQSSEHQCSNERS